MTVTLELDGHTYELREHGPQCSKIFRDGKELPAYKLRYEGSKTLRKGGHVGAPTEEIAKRYLEHVHEELNGHVRE